VEQETIFKFMQEDWENLDCGAVAGSGKSTTIKWTMSLMPKHQQAAYLAFNKDIVNAIAPECPPNVTVKTAHSFGYASMAKRFGRLFVDAKKVDKILKEYSFLDPDKSDYKNKGQVYQLLGQASSLVDMLRLTMTDENNINLVKEVIGTYNIDLANREDDIISLLPEIYEKILDKGNVIDFVDMMWMPIRLDLDIQKFPMLYVDERQDLSNLLIEYVFRMAGGRVMSVGDSRQSIYNFAGSNAKCTEILIDKFQSEQLPLNTCYRCGKNIIERAKTIVPNIEAFEGNGDGEVRMLGKLDTSMEDGSMVLSRRNADLIRPCFEMIKAGRKANIKGRDIGKGIKGLASKFKVGSIDAFKDELEEYREARIEEIMSVKNPMLSKVDYLNDQVDALLAISETCSTVQEVPMRIDMLFSEENKGVIFSSIHRSKGLEADHVAIIEYPRIRIEKEGMTQDQREQEANLEYVAITRAKKRLDLCGMKTKE
jgi:superfamily I DNA/RNA helicase